LADYVDLFFKPFTRLPRFLKPSGNYSNAFNPCFTTFLYYGWNGRRGRRDNG